MAFIHGLVWQVVCPSGRLADVKSLAWRITLTRSSHVQDGPARISRKTSPLNQQSGGKAELYTGENREPVLMFTNILCIYTVRGEGVGASLAILIEQYIPTSI